MKTVRCIYCPMGLGTTRDHIPPRCFFGVMPNPAITVPCCDECRLKDQRDDEFVRNLLTSTRFTERHQSVRGKLESKKLRSYERNPEKILKLNDIVRFTPLGRAFDFNNPIVDRFLERVSRAVLYDAYQQTYFAARAEWTHLSQEAQVLFSKPIEERELIRKHVGEVMSYLTALPFDRNEQYVNLRFYTHLLFAVRLERS